MLLACIDRQIALGKAGYVCIKANSVTEREVIDKLAEASRAGVEVQLIIRGICCILPGTPSHPRRAGEGAPEADAAPEGTDRRAFSSHPLTASTACPGEAP